MWCQCCFFNDKHESPELEIEMSSITNMPDIIRSEMLVSDMNASHDDDQSSISMDENHANRLNDDLNLHFDQPQSLPTIQTKQIKKRVVVSHKPPPASHDSISSNEEHVALVIKPTYIKAHSSDQQMNSASNSLEETVGEALIPLRAAIVWLLAITLCISAISDVIVDTIDGFAEECHISEIFTSVIIVPFFSNIAEQVSAVLFAYRNKMDLCLGVTVGSAIQILTCVLPGCVLCGWGIDRSMSLFFEGYETCCLVLGVLSVSAILHGGTTNWLAGIFFIGMYLIFAAGFWFHVEEDLSVDEELILQNSTIDDIPT